MRTGRELSIAAHRRALCAAVMAGFLVSVAAACNRSAGAAAPFSSARITRDGRDAFTVIDQTAGARASTPSDPGSASVTGLRTNVGQNSRFVFGNTWTTSRDQQSCATVASDSGPIDQEGLALRITTRSDGSARAVVFGKNVFLGVTAAFNVYGMDGSNARTPFVELGFHDYRNLDGGRIQIRVPYTMCARVVGNVFTAKVWHPDRTREPAWNDRNSVFSLTLPAAWVGTGSAGYYFGHLRADDTITYTNMRSLTATFG
ncbi:MAG TPA: hypothetical protein VIB48_01905 [Acidimicrobiia bacterium]|jgi:hypothetical protein